VKIERIETIYSQGTAERQEDGCVVYNPFFGVVDGFSASASFRSIRFKESSGETITKLILEIFRSAYSDKTNSDLEKIILQANYNVRELQKALRILMGRADQLAGASFVFVKIGEETIEIIQGGDCFAVWSYGSGECGATKNQAYLHVAANLQTVAALMEKNNGDRIKMWREFLPILSSRRKRDINNPDIESGYAVLNGQPAVARCWQRLEIPVAGLQFLLLLSDGFNPYYAESAEETRMAGRLIFDYGKVGLGGILEIKRRAERENKLSYTDQEEATALAVVFR